MIPNLLSYQQWPSCCSSKASSSFLPLDLSLANSSIFTSSHCFLLLIIQGSAQMPSLQRGFSFFLLSFRPSFLPPSLPPSFLSFAFQGRICDIWKFTGQGMNQSCSCQPTPQPQQHKIQVCYLHGGSQKHRILNPLSWGQGSVPHLRGYQWGLLPLSHSGNSQIGFSLSSPQLILFPYLALFFYYGTDIVLFIR